MSTFLLHKLKVYLFICIMINFLILILPIKMLKVIYKVAMQKECGQHWNNIVLNLKKY